MSRTDAARGNGYIYDCAGLSRHFTQLVIGSQSICTSYLFDPFQHFFAVFNQSITAGCALQSSFSCSLLPPHRSPPRPLGDTTYSCLTDKY
ncbi:hypothetical protein OPQ81_006429 [Rhizoctonia solani]|nr:hypothetical protein OPQ81_006429 [Rhizoctonia solani]